MGAWSKLDALSHVTASMWSRIPLYGYFNCYDALLAVVKDLIVANCDGQGPLFATVLLIYWISSNSEGCYTTLKHNSLIALIVSRSAYRISSSRSLVSHRSRG